ncbi:MAG: zinc ribbon domain-containing protein [Thermoplasmata archaeon]
MDAATIALGAVAVVVWIGSLALMSSVLSARARSRQRKTAVQRVHQRKISVIARIDGAKKCLICMGVIKKDLKSIDCKCGSNFHYSCAARVGICPGCGTAIDARIPSDETADRIEEFQPIRTMPLSREDRLFLLEDKFLVGEIDEETYQTLKNEAINDLPEPVFCAVCGNRLYENERCTCSNEGQRCPECGSELDEGDRFCRKCGVVLSDEFKEELFQCSSCGRIVSSSERICSCGALLLDPGESICSECGHPVSPNDRSCPNCGRLRIIELLVCPSCGKEVSPSDFECDCGAIFQDMIERIECPECGAIVDLEDNFCRTCGIQFEKNSFVSMHK